MKKQKQLFASWVDQLARIVLVLAVGGLLYMVVLVLTATSPETQASGYRPVQPVPYSHALHAGELGIDCRYCHVGVDTGAKATLPSTELCMNCHATIKTESEKLAVVRESFQTGMPIEWVRVHDLPDFVYFDHSAHVTRGIGCVSCHGRVDQMDEAGVFQALPLNMGWCLDCHRAPEQHLRPVEYVTQLDWIPAEDQTALGRRLREMNNINPSTDCSTCHR
ncbi:cytochrome c3 family protein [bacterium]|nr:cytochrome c3 family protein [bacterium]